MFYSIILTKRSEHDRRAGFRYSLRSHAASSFIQRCTKKNSALQNKTTTKTSIRNNQH